MNWDFLITFGVIVFIILVIWARVSGQTVAQVIVDIKEMIYGGAEEAHDRVDEVIMYE